MESPLLHEAFEVDIADDARLVNENIYPFEDYQNSEDDYYEQFLGGDWGALPFLASSVEDHVRRFGIMPTSSASEDYFANIVSISEEENGEYPFEALEDAVERYWYELWLYDEE